MAKTKRILIHLECTVCKNRNYTTEKNPENAALKKEAGREKLLLRKYCKRCRKVTEHKEVKI
ncbi:50S ribosomal protein L33 [Candidatus Curtissbacteria bacterium RIFOXYB1_FULL_41_59]|uniref:Large ribosomal subunit protein bL33 n=1 Tax=Candidatus Curtissbacteria bacterium RIFOXYA1_FULL_41_14 TaxID=1797737 RepID=A0A1F5HED7_9BACT|nr:MAG: 50S ribosomal protein L33 [Candidatus Curtissbacteria bacterium RIFCSPHIGHO2_12_FULL_41_13]OGE02527.1 MAG: 50S ribosomal protein L33 [Candidatus Curtissbacteria bacterium RIFOXYA1_FULL_41_14]OGE04771.1 MAG: 50S ribosomal protein L33 [Candidatus Curtissbacteria bacterium RIFOXYB1_FULL_41_59]OGE07295.1 MAG: 50S ribosomal protein L33 [Candidatus Curtissbacteria bacterium RIFOXYD1_FULL_41_36]OGE10209.1 MAG: 50S ribosomal protein L33 [Candidatus Curtissbacteria bacterium RIFOXYC2_FULL_41_11]